MKRKINRQLVFISLLAVVLTFLLMSVVFNHILQIQVMDDLKTYARMLISRGIEENNAGGVYENTSYDGGKVRISVIAADGNVLNDSEADIDDMDNHTKRPEVAEALQYGEGESVRYSATLNRATFYYAVCLEDGTILRVAKESHSLWSILAHSFPVMLLAVLVLFTVCLVFSHYLTRSLIYPIERMAADIDNINQTDMYEELVPFAETIKEQHEAIVNTANVRQEFTANVSHELKTPLAVISGYSELIENGMATGQDAVRFAAGIHQSANRLLTLINDTIRLSEMDVLVQEIPFETLNLYELARDTVDMLQIRAEERRVTMTLEGEPCFIQGDKQMIEEVIYNLCDNALSYNNIGGKVCVIARPYYYGSVLCVKDTGIGIPKEHQERIFERFYRVDKSRSKLTGGTGLGLAIVKHIVAVHHAQISLESEAGKGTEITVFFEKKPGEMTENMEKTV